jgi:hypothetical protein
MCMPSMRRVCCLAILDQVRAQSLPGADEEKNRICSTLLLFASATALRLASATALTRRYQVYAQTATDSLVKKTRP